MHVRVYIPRVVYDSWLEAIAVWLSSLWMDPDLPQTLKIVILLHCLQLSKRDLSVANVFHVLERQYAYAYGDCQRTQ